MKKQAFLLLIIIILIINCTRPVEQFTFVVIGDTRPDRPKILTSQQDFLRQIDSINKLNPDLAVNVGDLILGYRDSLPLVETMWDLYEKEIANFKVPYYHVVGNHDIWDTASHDIWKKRYGPVWYSKTHKNSHFIFLNSEDVINFPSKIKGPQMEWLKKELETHKDINNIFVFLHQPLWAQDAHWNRDVHPVLKAAGNVKAVFAGHWHQYIYFPEKDGIKYYITGGGGAMIPPNPDIGGFYHFLNVSVRGKQFHVDVHRDTGIAAEDVVTSAQVTKIEKWETNTVAFPEKVYTGKGKPGVKGFIPFSLLKRGYNYKLKVANVLTEKQNIVLDWADSLKKWKITPSKRDIILEPGQDSVVSFRIKALKPGKVKRTPLCRISRGQGEPAWTFKARIPQAKRIGRVKQAKGEIQIDGKLSEPDWKKGRLAGRLTYDEGWITVNTQASILYRGNTLYVGLVCSENRMTDRIIDSVHIHKGDDAEISIAPFWRGFFKVGLNSKGQYYTRHWHPWLVEPWEIEFQLAVQEQESSWSVELAIDLEQLGASIEKEGIIKFNYGRIRVLKDGTDEVGTWCGGFNQYRKFGYLKFL
jgi:hypothetical protein